jgi:tetratricopeptide (TPR) repeat protein/GTP-binding protein EngB required for normal cell division
MSIWSRIERRIGDLAGDLLLDEYRDQLQHARALLDGGEPAQAAELLEALLAGRRDHGQALVLLGAARLDLGQAEAAREAFDRALRVRAGDPVALAGHGEALMALGRHEEALASFGRAVTEAAGDREVLAGAYRGLGLTWRRLGEIDKAVRELRKAVTEAPLDALARGALGEALLADDGGHLDEARRHLDRATELDGTPPVAYVALGRLALADGAPAQASQHFSRAVEVADQGPDAREVRIGALVGLGDAALAQGDAATAHQWYLHALQQNPRGAEIHARVARAHRAIGNHDAALGSYERALALGAGPAVLKEALDTALAAGDRERAGRLAGDLLAVEPDHPRALVAMAVARVDSQPEVARAMLQSALARSDDAEGRVALARLDLAEPGIPAAQRAATAALAALRHQPGHVTARALLAEARERELGSALPADADIRAVAAGLERLVASRRDLASLAGDVARAAADLDSPLLVTVMGEFSSGKSSFVNAFIGHDVAPTGITPTTATINVVRYGREQAGRVVGRDGRVTELPWDALVAYLKAIAPDAATAIDRVEILLPHESLERVNIVDTPGLNSIQPEHEETARAFIARADAVVWVFTAGQGGKASERKALERIRGEGKRVLGVLNKRDQLSDSDVADVIAHIQGQLGELVEHVVPFSARRALAWKRAGKADGSDDGNWSALAGALEERFFAQARQLKHDACARRLRAVVATTRASLDAARGAAESAGTAARAAADAIDAAAVTFTDVTVTAERRALGDVAQTLYRRAAREVLDLVRPRRLPFGQHSATAADRDYLIALLDAGFEAELVASRRRVAAALAAAAATAQDAAAALAPGLGADVASDLARIAADRQSLVMAQVFDRARAYLRGFLEGGYVENFFRADLPRLELSEDAAYHALVRSAPDLDREIGAPLARAGGDALDALARRLDHWAGVADVLAFDLEVGAGRALDAIAAALPG